MDFGTISSLCYYKQCYKKHLRYLCVFLLEYLWDRLTESWLWLLDWRVLLLLHTAKFPSIRVISFCIPIHSISECLFRPWPLLSGKLPESYRWEMVTDKVMAERQGSNKIFLIHLLSQCMFTKCSATSGRDRAPVLTELTIWCYKEDTGTTMPCGNCGQGNTR